MPDKEKLLELLNKQIEDAGDGNPSPSLREWKATTGVVLRAAVGEENDLVQKFEKLRYDYHGPWFSGMQDPNADGSYTRGGVLNGVALLKAAIVKVNLHGVTTQRQGAGHDTSARTRIFVVHGHDDGLKETVARFLLQLTGEDPVILHEQLNAGDTIIEKLERFAATAAYAVVLATADDVGRAVTAPPDDLLPRARQNVVFELGYFFAALGRSRVALLYQAGVERPSDTDGILHIAVDAFGAWKTRLTAEIEGAGFAVDRTVLR